MYRLTVVLCTIVLSLTFNYSIVNSLQGSVKTLNGEHPQRRMKSEIKYIGNISVTKSPKLLGSNTIKLQEKPKKRWNVGRPGVRQRDVSRRDVVNNLEGRDNNSPGTYGEIHNRQLKTEHLLANLRNYEVVIPVQVDSDGTLISNELRTSSHRHKREVPETNQPDNANNGSSNAPEIHYMLSAYGKQFHLNLTLNMEFVAPNFEVEYWNQHRASDFDIHIPTKCHYTGHLKDTANSKVAVSNCLGLHGMFATEDEEYFVEPLWNMTNDVRADGHYHVIYKRSSFNKAHQYNHCGVSDESNLPPWWLKSSSIQNQNEVNKIKHKRYEKKRNRRRNRHKRSVSKENYVETLIVADKTMIDYHGNQEIEPYILTVMNIVYNLFRDSSVGNSIHLLVTRLILLTEDQPDLQITHHADKTLESFCEWQTKINPAEGTEALRAGTAHHDNAILITRLDICTYKNQPCGTLGLAPVAGMCEPHRSCSINEDIGLASAFTISHELGHNFGMHHDGAGNRCGFKGYEAAKIMAAQLNKNTEPFSWSSCSRQYISDFLDSGRGSCLENKPLAKDFEYPVERAGRKTNGDAQCKLQFGSLSKQCKFTNVCRELWCVGDDGECITNNIPPAEGTACITNRLKKGWCYRGKCMRNGAVVKVTDGSWSAWSGWGHCTRTCGGGVESSIRRCDNPEPKNGGKYCIGERKRYKSCNTQDCPIASRDFREMQCQNFNIVPFRNKLYKWVPFDGGGRMKPCALNCLATGYNFYTERTPKVVDGTRCFPDSLDMCINGQCRHVGCDRVLGSDTKEDKCRVCSGDGSTCHTVEGHYTEPLRGLEDTYKEIVRIPEGALSIRINESTASRNYLALMTENGTYFINGGWTIDWSRKFHIANTVFHYERPNDGPEVLRAVGPTSEALIVMVLLQEENKGIYYEYSMPNAESRTYQWQYSPWSPCSLTCGSGLMQSVAMCVQSENKRSVRQELCIENQKPERKVKSCNNQACPPQWIMSKWSTCSKSCGEGTQFRRVLCLRQINKHESEVLSQEQCDGNRPSTQQSCQISECPPQWDVSKWSRCDSICGPGLKRRRVSCVGSGGSTLVGGNCSISEKPPISKKCNSGVCPPPKWATGSWGWCSAGCGKGVQFRQVECRTITGKSADSCKVPEKPSNVQECDGLCIPKPGDPACRDVNKISYCPLVMRFRFCDRDFFRKVCCKTCSELLGNRRL